MAVGNEIRALLFSTITLTDDDKAAQSRANPDLGSLKVIKSTLESSDVHEGKKTLGGHRIKIGEKVATHTCDVSAAVEFIDKEPFAVFLFRYRPEDILQAMGHIRTSTDQSLLGVKRNASEASESEDESGASDEEQEIAAKIAALSQRMKTLKKRKRVKVEESPILILSGTTGTRETSPIVLSSDDEVVELD
ncbi:hypothetical protein PIIN_06720 [Serendipita indica DSM 11827]|uniref:Uncharacterized protein n=1 Tax=Serendipita indica (strain DSM 11827) TaxID=1109443 RepID=G4TN89_SERID|nr:hypothetical protein PIIN_06720 [Serendipita indica DSM 11827]